MKHKTTPKVFILTMILTMGASNLHAQLLWGDQGNGTYKNPVLNVDYSDPDVIRVGEKYFMVASDFHFMGMQVLESADMVNWQIVSQIYSRFDMPGWDEVDHYGHGSWAPSIRHHAGRFYVYFCTPDEGLFMSSAENARGPWTPLHCVKNIAGWEDPCPFWDDDGTAYLGHSKVGAGPIIIHKMSEDGKELLDDGATVYTGPVAEGTKIMKRNGWYYLLIPEGGVPTGWQTVLRSKDIYGPYEKRVVLERGSTPINGPHQGSLVDTPNDEWWFYHFQSTPSLGRVVHLQPARWKDDWPLMGVDIDGNGIGEPVAVWSKPDIGVANMPSLPQTSDDFSADKLSPQWQWCHNPDNSKWSLTEKPGWLTLHALPAQELQTSKNMLTQKTMGYQGEVTVTIDCRGITKGSFAGLVCLGGDFRGIGVSGDGVYTETNGQRQAVATHKPKKIYLRLTLDDITNQHQFFYSTDGKKYQPVGEPFPMSEAYWKGYRVGLFCYGDDGGKASFDDFKYKVLK